MQLEFVDCGAPPGRKFYRSAVRFDGIDLEFAGPADADLNYLLRKLAGWQEVEKVWIFVDEHPNLYQMAPTWL